QERGEMVFGIDTSPAAVEICRERGLAVEHLEMAQLDPSGGTFDTVLLLGNGLSLLGTPTAAATLLRALAAVTRRGGRLIGMSIDPATAATFPVHADYQAETIARGRPPGQYTVRARHDRLATPWFENWQIRPTELVALVADSPWRLESVRPDESGSYLTVLV